MASLSGLAPVGNHRIPARTDKQWLDTRPECQTRATSRNNVEPLGQKAIAPSHPAAHSHGLPQPRPVPPHIKMPATSASGMEPK